MPTPSIRRCPVRAIALTALAAASLVVSSSVPSRGGSATPATAAAAATAPAVQAAPGTTRGDDGDRVVISIGDEHITAAQFAAMVGDMPPTARSLMRGPRRRLIVEDLVQSKMLAHEARRQGLDRTAVYERTMNVVRDQVLADMLRRETAKEVEPDAVRRYYDEHPEQFRQTVVRHILVRTADSVAPPRPGRPQLDAAQAKAAAEALYRRVIQPGQDFAAIATAESDDTQTAEHGGLLPPFGKFQAFDPAVEQAVAALPIGGITEPIRTAYGYHIVRLEGYQVAPLESVRPEVLAAVAADRVRQLGQHLRESLNVTLDEAVVGAMPAGHRLPAAADTEVQKR